MKKTIIFLIIFILAFSAFIFWRHTRGTEKALIDFVKRHFVLENGGVLIDSADRGTVLSESCGLYMLVCARLGDRDAFDRTFGFVKSRLMSPYGVLHWKIDLKTGQKEDSSASIDDMTVIAALILAHDEWGDKKYLDEALALAAAVKKNEVKDGYLMEAFSFNSGESYVSEKVNISYLDLATMRGLSGHDPDWGPIFEKNKELVLRAQLPNGLFYETYYPQSGEFDHQDGNMINQLYCAMHLAEAGEPKTSIKMLDFLSWLWARKKAIYISYDLDASPRQKDQDAAVYALCARLYALLGDNYHRDKAYKKMLSLRSGFRYNETGYNSFSELQALLAITQE